MFFVHFRQLCFRRDCFTSIKFIIKSRHISYFILLVNPQTFGRTFKILSALRKKIEGLSRIVIIENNKSSDLIDINDYVTISISFDGEDEEEMFFKLVASSSPDFNGEVSEISVNAPLGASVYQKKIGDKGSYQVGEDVANFVILDKRKTLEPDEQMESKRSK